MRFVAIDLETANPRMSSICQIGIVVFENGREVSAERQLVDPRDYFDPYNVAIHGITQEQVSGAPCFNELHDWLCQMTTDQIVVCHTHFDRVALAQACRRHSLELPPCNWLDTAQVARRAWSEFSRKGYGLANLARHFGIQFQHHDALHDARTAGLILLEATKDTGFDPTQWVERCRQGISAETSIRRDGDGDGPLVGESIAFTGALQMPRREAADLAHEAGAAVESGVTKRTTMLVVGDQDIEKLVGHDKSSKHRKAEKLIATGQPIRIVGEADFLSLVGSVPH
ncbi:MAG: exonuclease domain-containing protein [Sphingomonadaceae bacterium]